MQQPLLVLPAVVDEVHRIENLLRTVPDVASAAALVDRAGLAGDPVDDLAEAVHRHLGLELDAPVRGNDDANALDLADLPHAATTIIETVRWRLLRVARAVSLTQQARTVPQEEA